MDDRERNDCDTTHILVGSINANHDNGNIPPNCKNIILSNKSMTKREEKNERNANSCFWNIFPNCGTLKDIMFDNCLEETKIKGTLNDSLHNYNFRKNSKKKSLSGSNARSGLDGDKGIFVVTNSKARHKKERRSISNNTCITGGSFADTERKRNDCNFVYDRKSNCSDITLKKLDLVNNFDKEDSFFEKGLQTLNTSSTEKGSICTGPQTRITVEEPANNTLRSDFEPNGNLSEDNTISGALRFPPEEKKNSAFLPLQIFENKVSLPEPEEEENSNTSISDIEESKSYQEYFIESGIFEEQIIAAALHEAELEEHIRLEESGRYHCIDLFITRVPLSLWSLRNVSAVMADKNNKFPQKRCDGGKNLFFVNPFSNEHTERMKQSIGNLLPTATIANLTTKKYTLPDKNVASQVLMYRQLLHTECKPGLRLSRAYQGTPAQKAVKHMPWWEQGVETSKKMVISYDNLVVRLWLNGAIMPYTEGGYAAEHQGTIKPKDNEEMQENYPEDIHTTKTCPKEGKKDNEEGKSESEVHDEEVSSAEDNLESSSEKVQVETLINSQGLPPIPHDYWVDRLGFQQSDPVTDFRSGGVLSLAMLVHIVESCPSVHARFLPNGDVNMLPFGITCINITDMIAKFCMFSKSVDRMDALLSQKPFWRMFGDPNALLSLQELSMEILCNVVVELGRERKKLFLDGPEVKESLHGEHEGKVTVFDFSEILSRTEKRVRDDLLASGPKSVDELRSIANQLRLRYERDITRKERKVRRSNERKASLIDEESTIMKQVTVSNNESDSSLGPYPIASNLKTVTGSILGTANNIFNKVKQNDRESKDYVESANKETRIENKATTSIKEINSTGMERETSSNIAATDFNSKPAAISDNIKIVTGNILGTANNILRKIKQNDKEEKPNNVLLSEKGTDSKQSEASTIEVVDFVIPPSNSSSAISPEAGREIESVSIKGVPNEIIEDDKAVSGSSLERKTPKEPSTFTIDDEIGML